MRPCRDAVRGCALVLLLACLVAGCSSGTPRVGRDGGAAEGGVWDGATGLDGAGSLDGGPATDGGRDGASGADAFVWDGRGGGKDLAGRRDGSSVGDGGGRRDGGSVGDGGGRRDGAAWLDGAGGRDRGAVPDTAPRRDSGAVPDTSARRDLGLSPDAAARRDSGSVATPPCVTGQGVAAYRFHFGPSGTYATLDAWGLRSTAWWEVVPVWASSQLVDQNQSLHLGSSSAYVRVRWSFDGIQSFTKGSLCIQARSYSTGTSSKFRPWSPIHGDTVSGLVSVYPYAWYCVDWTNFMSVNDQPGLLGYRLYPDSYGAASLAIHAVELCLQGVVYK